MPFHFQNPSDFIIKGYLEQSKVIAFVGLSNRQETAAYKVATFMQAAGYTLVPVNPKLAGNQILGQTVYGRLQDIPHPIDIVSVFRRSEFLPEVARDFLQVDALIFWAQLGLESQEVEVILRQADRDHIVMDRCLKIEYQKLLA